MTGTGTAFLSYFIAARGDDIIRTTPSCKTEELKKDQIKMTQYIEVSGDNGKNTREILNIKHEIIVVKVYESISL